MARRDRWRRLIVGSLAAFLVLILIAPLTTGLITGDDPPAASTTTPPFTIPWVPVPHEGASISGPTPCPPTDGSADRITQFDEAPPVCIDAGAIYELTFDTSLGSITVPVDPAVHAAAANLAAVFGWYHTYEGTPVQVFSNGFVGIGGLGDAGFTLPAFATDPFDERFEPGAVLAIGLDGQLNGALMIVLDETGAGVLRENGVNHVRVGTMDDLEAARAIHDTAPDQELLLIDAVTVTEVS